MLEHDHVHLFKYIWGCFHSIMAELTSCDRDGMVCEAANIYSLAHDRKGLLTPDFNPSHFGVSLIAVVRNCV